MTRYCVMYEKNGKEKRSPWFKSRERVDAAREILAAKYGATVVYVD